LIGTAAHSVAAAGPRNGLLLFCAALLKAIEMGRESPDIGHMR
jgi:hypothetical protein